MERMYIYVAGPYTADTKEEIAANVAAADAAAREIAYTGHIPFCPHKMTWGWEDDPHLGYDDFIGMDDLWLMQCDALLFIAPSPGANREKNLAEALGIPVYTSIEDLPQAGAIGLKPFPIEHANPLWYELLQVWRRNAALMQARGQQYREWWRDYGPVVMVVEVLRKAHSLLTRAGIGVGAPAHLVQEFYSGLDQRRGAWEDCRDLANYIYLVEAITRLGIEEGRTEWQSPEPVTPQSGSG